MESVDLFNTFDIQELIALSQHDVEQGRLEEALVKLKHVVQQEDVPPVAYVLLAKLYARLRLFAYAKDNYAQYLEIDPTVPELRFEYGMVQFDLGDAEGALTAWNQLLATHPTYPPALFYAALALSRTNIADARRHLDVLMQTAEPDNLYVGRAKQLLADLDGQAASPVQAVPAEYLAS